MPTTGRRRLWLTLIASVIAVLLQAGPAVATSWKYHGEDGLEVKSGNGKAQAAGHVRWYHGPFPKGYLHQGDYAKGSKIYALQPVGCIWAKVSYGYQWRLHGRPRRPVGRDQRWLL